MQNAALSFTLSNTNQPDSSPNTSVDQSNIYLISYLLLLAKPSGYPFVSWPIYAKFNGLKFLAQTTIPSARP